MRHTFLISTFFIISISVFCQNKIPPGTIQINDSLFIDKTPVTNQMYIEFVAHIKANNPYLLSGITIPNKITFKETISYTENPKYQYFPILQITKQQAENYCKWRSEMVQYLWDTKDKTNNKRVIYRLPYKQEYIDSEDYFKEIKKYKSFKGATNELKIKKNSKRLFVTYNITELTRDDSFYGNNWKEESISSLPNNYTGFRCICEVSKK